jgi:hypothetical protein
MIGRFIFGVILAFAGTVVSAAEGLDCTITLNASAMPNGQVGVQITAPCHRNKTGLFHHSGLLVSFKTDLQGGAQAILPAMAQRAVVIASFADGAGAVATADLGDQSLPARAVFQALGPVDARLDTDAAPLDLGPVADGYQARVYSFVDGFPDDLAPFIPVLQGNCGGIQDLQMIQIGADATARLQDISVQMPPCEFAGQQVQLPVHLGL